MLKTVRFFGLLDLWVADSRSRKANRVAILRFVSGRFGGFSGGFLPRIFRVREGNFEVFDPSCALSMSARLRGDARLCDVLSIERNIASA